MRSLRAVFLRFVLRSLLVSLAPSVGHAQYPTGPDIQRLVDDAVRTGRATGMIVGVLAADGSQRYYTGGVANPAGARVGLHTVFEIGSITKVFTATLLADMVLRGEVRLDDPVAKLLPSDVHVPSFNGQQITLLDLSTHRSGLPPNPSNLNSFDHYSELLLNDFLSHYTLPRAPGARYEYSNVGMGLLGFALGRRAGTSYESLVRQRILEPLGMNETGITLTAAMRSNLAHGYNDIGDTVSNWRWDMQAIVAAGALQSTASDMLRFAAANLSTKAGSPYEAMRDAHRPRRETDNSAPRRLVLIGLGWIVAQDRYDLPAPAKHRVITWQAGGTTGFRTFLGLDLEAHRAVVVLTNTGGSGTEDIGRHLLDTTSPLAKPPATYAVVQAARRGGADSAIQRYREIKDHESTRWRLDQYTLNGAGLWLVAHRDRRDALTLFELNVQEYPNEPNPFDTLGETYLALGDTARAIVNYKRSLQIDSTWSTDALALLKRLHAWP